MENHLIWWTEGLKRPQVFRKINLKRNWRNFHLWHKSITPTPALALYPILELIYDITVLLIQNWKKSLVTEYTAAIVSFVISLVYLQMSKHKGMKSSILKWWELQWWHVRPQLQYGQQWEILLPMSATPPSFPPLQLIKGILWATCATNYLRTK